MNKYTYELTKKIVVTIDAETPQEALAVIADQAHTAVNTYEWDRAEVNHVLIESDAEKPILPKAGWPFPNAEKP